LAQDWSRCADDFEAEGFVGLDARFTADPAAWRLTFPTLESYRPGLGAAESRFCRGRSGGRRPRRLVRRHAPGPDGHRGEHALVYKKFSGEVKMRGGKTVPLHWQSLFFSRRAVGRWKLRGFVGYLPFPWPEVVQR